MNTTNNVDNNNVATADQLVETLTATYQAQFKYDEEGHKRAYAVLRDTIAVWEKITGDKALRDAMHYMAAERDITVNVDNSKGCPIMWLVNLASGRWVEETDDGKVTKKWKVNRSHERNAYAARFAVDNGFSAEDVYDHLVNKKKFKLKGEGQFVDPSIEEMRKADSRTHNSNDQRGDVWDAEVKAQLGEMKVLKTVKLSETQIKQFTPHEGYVLVMARITKDSIELLGDAGKDRDTTIKTLKARRLAQLEAGAPKQQLKEVAAPVRATKRSTVEG